MQESVPAHTAGPPVVLLTGAGDQTASWVSGRDRQSGAFRVIGYRVGMGRADDRPGPRTLAGYVDELAGVLAATQMTVPVLLIGRSLGGN